MYAKDPMDRHVLPGMHHMYIQNKAFPPFCTNQEGEKIDVLIIR
jgi:hypothetical protein